MTNNTCPNHAQVRLARTRSAIGLLVLLVITMTTVQPATASSFVPLGELPGARFSAAFGVSGDGSTVVGVSEVENRSFINQNEAFRWTLSTGLQSTGDLPGNGVAYRATDVSADGSIVVGSLSNDDGIEPFRWTSSGDIHGLGDLPGRLDLSQGLGISDDGTTVVGSSINENGSGEAFRWTAAGGIQGLGDLPGGGFFSVANDASEDGSTIVGQSFSEDGLEAFRWTAAGGVQGLGDLPGGGFFSVAHDVSADGSTIVGEGSGANGPEAFRWTAAAGLQGLGFLGKRGFNSRALGVSSDGTVVVGASVGDSVEAFVWDSSNGMRSLKDLLLSDGIDLTDWRLAEAHGVSQDGKTIVGFGTNPAGNIEAFLATLTVQVPEPTSLTLLGLFIGALGLMWRKRPADS